MTGFDQLQYCLEGVPQCHELRKTARVRSVELKDSGRICAEKSPKLFRGLGCVQAENMISN